MRLFLIDFEPCADLVIEPGIRKTSNEMSIKIEMTPMDELSEQQQQSHPIRPNYTRLCSQGSLISEVLEFESYEC